MKNVFISYSTKDEEYAKEICMQIERCGCHCWAAYRRQDLRPGQVYASAIAEAIAISDVFVLIVSRHSIASTQVHNELMLANGRLKKGLLIIPVFVDGTLDPETLNPVVDYVLSGKQAVFWEKEEDRKAFLEQMSEKQVCINDAACNHRKDVSEETIYKCGKILSMAMVSLTGLIIVFFYRLFYKRRVV